MEFIMCDILPTIQLPTILLHARSIIDLCQSFEELWQFLLEHGDGVIHALVDGHHRVPELHVIARLVARPDRLELAALGIKAAQKTLRRQKRNFLVDG